MIPPRVFKIECEEPKERAARALLGFALLVGTIVAFAWIICASAYVTLEPPQLPPVDIAH